MTGADTCPCGHEVTDDGECIAWDSAGQEHFFSRHSNLCRCHYLPLDYIEGNR